MNWEYSTYSKVDSDVANHFPFTKARENQLETISEIKHAIDKGYKYIILEAGTGTGKSAIAATLALMFESTYILTVTKQLQDQYLNDFSRLGFKLVKGRGNFKCRKYAEDKIDKCCDEGRCIIEGYHCEHSTKNKPILNIEKDNTCEYDYQKWIALNSDTVISNYPYLFLELNHVSDFEKRKLMIFDEAHNLEDNIMNQLKLEFTRRELKDEVSINLSKEVIDKLQLGNSSIWIKFILKVQNKYKKQLTKIKDLKNKSEIKEKITYFKRRIDDCDRFVKYIQHDPSKWIFDYDSYYGVAEFKPIKVNNYAKKTFFEYGDVCLFMSASILDYELFAEWLGIDKDEIYAIRQKSPFEINRNPIITYDNFNMSYNNLSRNAPLTINTVKDILETHKNDKGIIHTISYKCKDFLMKNLNSNRLIDHKTHNRIRQLNKFKKSNNPLVLISPSMNEGVDLPGDLCRFQIIYKIPYPSLADKQTKIRSSIDPKWYKYKTALALVQTVGRGMRYEKDYCTTYFIDSRLLPFVAVDMAENNFLPDTFIDAINIGPAVIDESDDVLEEVSLIKDDLKQDNFDIVDNNEFDDFVINDGYDDTLDVESNELTFYEKVDLKYSLYLEGKELLNSLKYEEAILFYKNLLNNELFENDYHPYLKLSQAYHEAGKYKNEVDIIEKFFESGIYARTSTIKWFKKKLLELDDLGYYDYSEVDELELKFKRFGAKNRKLSTLPVPLARDISSYKKNFNQKPVNLDSHIFDEILKMPPDLDYDAKIDFKYDLIMSGKSLMEDKSFKKAIVCYTRLLSHELFINDYHPYLKLAKCYHKSKRYDKEVECITQFFKSGIYVSDKIFKSFKRMLNILYVHGFYDFSLFKDLEMEYLKNGELNEYLSDEPVLRAIKIINAKENGEFINVLKSNHDNSYDLIINSDDNLSFYEKVDLKYDLCLKGSELLDNKDYDEAIDFYEEILENELFINDYHPYLMLAKAYHSARYYDKEVELIEKFFKSGIYCSKSKINKFKKILEILDKLGYYDYSKIYQLELEFEKNGSKNKKLSGTPIPLAVNIKKGKKNINNEKIDYESSEFDNILKMNGNLSYEEKINFKYKLYLKGKELFENNKYRKAIIFYNKLLNHELFVNDYHPYLKLAKCYRKNYQFDKEVDIITKFFISGIYCNDKNFKWFKKCLKQLYKYGNYDFSSFYILENEFNQNGALNKDLSNQPVPPAAIIKDIISLDNSQMELNIDNNENKTNGIGIKKPSVYSREYFNKLANEIQSNPDFVSDREISQHVEDDFIEISFNYDKINQKADLINQGRELEKEDKQEAIKFYDSLKTNELFVHDYYPYRRQCILFKNKIKDDFKDLGTIIELFNHEIYCNPHQYIWLHNKLLELIDKLNLSDYEMHNIDNLLKNYGENEEKYFKLQNTPVPIAERIFKDENGLRLLSQEKYDFVQDVYYINELGVGYIRRGEYETAISYYLNLLENDILYYQYHAYKQLGRICKEMNNPEEFKRLYENHNQ